MTEEKIIADFGDMISVSEIKDMLYVFTFTNGYTKKKYVIRTYKEMFDLVFENRKVIDASFKIVSSEENKEHEQNSYTS